METEPQIIKDYVATGKLKLIYRHLIQIGDESRVAAEASECAADQGKFWEMRRQLYVSQDALYASKALPDTLTQLAQGLGMQGDTFAQCLRAAPHRAAIDADYAAAQAAGVKSRPVFDINGERLVGALPYDTFAKAIEAGLK